MPREFSPYALIETTFILSDYRYVSLPASAKVLYIALWARSFQQRRELLPHWYDTAAMQRDSNLDARTVKNAETSLQQSCLIERNEDGRIRVIGASEKGKVAWKDKGAKRNRKGVCKGAFNRAIEQNRTVIEEIYKHYPRKQNRRHGLDGIAFAIERGHDPQELLAKTKLYKAATDKWPRDKRTFIPHPGSWFNGDGFDDDPATWEQNSGPGKLRRIGDD